MYEKLLCVQYKTIFKKNDEIFFPKFCPQKFILSFLKPDVERSGSFNFESEGKRMK